MLHPSVAFPYGWDVNPPGSEPCIQGAQSLCPMIDTQTQPHHSDPMVSSRTPKSQDLLSGAQIKAQQQGSPMAPCHAAPYHVPPSPPCPPLSSLLCISPSTDLCVIPICTPTPKGTAVQRDHSEIVGSFTPSPIGNG